MATPDSSTRRLRLVDDQQQDQHAEAAAPDSELTAKQAAAFAALVANANQSAVERTLDQMNAEQLRSLAIALATQVNAAETATGEVADVGPDGICAIAIATAAQSFGTTRDAVLSADRHRAVTDARAVAMTAARRGGLTLPGVYVGRMQLTADEVDRFWSRVVRALGRPIVGCGPGAAQPRSVMTGTGAFGYRGKVATGCLGLIELPGRWPRGCRSTFPRWSSTSCVTTRSAYAPRAPCWITSKGPLKQRTFPG